MYKSKDLIDKALSYVGYLEKASDKDLDDFTVNAGRANYTRFCRDYEKYTKTSGYQPSYWCAEYVSCIVVETFGLTAARELLCGGLFASCSQGKERFAKAGQFHTGNPRPGDIIMYYKNGSSGVMGHTGIVTKVDSTYVYTVEGNTSSGSDVVIDNGGSVATKKYKLTNSRIAGYCRMALDGVDPTAGTFPSASKKKVDDENIASFQKWLNKKFSLNLVVDGIYGRETKRAAVKALQRSLNGSYKTSLAVDGLWGPFTEKAVESAENVENGSQGDFVYILQGMLYCLGFDPKGLDGQCGSNTVAAIKSFQTKKFPAKEVDGICGPKTWTALMN